MPIQNLPGFRDFYPDELAIRRHIFSTWREVARRYGFREYDGPPLESLDLFTKKSGEEIAGQLYNFVDKGERAVALRPEMTPTLARMVGAKEREYKKPIKWFSIPQLFRYERQQRGRLREHFQFNADIVGEADVSADAELVALAVDSLRALGLTADDFVVRVGSRHFASKVLRDLGVAEAKVLDGLSVIDKIEREKLEVTNAKLRECGLSDDRISELMKILESSQLDDPQATRFLELIKAKGLGDFVRIDLKIVRGLAYYTGIVFEIHDRKGQFRAIAGGGRYDNLIKLVTDNAVDLPALGFGMGDVVLTELLRERGKLPKIESQLDAYAIIVSEDLRTEALKAIHELREHGIAVDYSFTPQGVGKQFKAASALQARFAIVFGAEEWKLGQCKVKNLATGEERAITLQALAGALA
jgi:histidyl-tRNA synthetase